MEEQVFDPKGLMKEAFVIEGIAAPECRSIFLDWALGLPLECNVPEEVRRIIANYAPSVPATHPMLLTLQEALEHPAAARRRGGRGSRFPPVEG